MIADLVEEAEIKTQRRNEGVFFASVTFVRKVTQGIGAAVAGVLLTISQFPVGATPIRCQSRSSLRLAGFMCR